MVGWFKVKHYKTSCDWIAWFLSGPNCIVPKCVIGHTRLWVGMKTICPFIPWFLMQSISGPWGQDHCWRIASYSTVFSWGDETFTECAGCTAMIKGAVQLKMHILLLIIMSFKTRIVVSKWDFLNKIGTDHFMDHFGNNNSIWFRTKLIWVLQIMNYELSL